MADRHNNFDLLRVCAALSVMLSHAFLIGTGHEEGDPLWRLTGGQCALGVAGLFVFFTISGFLVSLSWETTGSSGRFLAKRALRLYPGLAVCLLLVTLGFGPALSALPPAAYFTAPGTWGFLIGNLLLDTSWHGLPQVWFSSFVAGGVVDAPLWSLPCEAIMYLMIAALGTLRLLRLDVMLALLAAGLLALAFDTASSNLLIGNLLWLLPFFIAGMLLYRLRAAPLFAPWIGAVAVAGLLASAAIGHFILLFPVFGSYLVIAVALSRRLPVIAAARFGDLSYGLYIYGWPIEQAVVYSLGGHAPWWHVLGFSLPPTLALAALSWHLVEAPALRLKPRNRAAVAPAAR